MSDRVSQASVKHVRRGPGGIVDKEVVAPDKDHEAPAREHTPPPAAPADEREDESAAGARD